MRALVLALSVAVAGVAFAACARGPQVVEAPVLSASAAASAMAAFARDAGASDDDDESGELHEGARYTGDYKCPQGPTSMTLAIEGVTGKAVRAVFEFHHVPSGTRGSYRVRGTFDAETGALTLKKDSWISRPAGYAMVDLEGQLRGAALKGKILAEGCGAFSLKLED